MADPKIFHFPDLPPSSTALQLRSNAGVFRSASGAVQTDDRDGEHWEMQLTFNNRSNTDKRRLSSLIGKLNGQANRVSIRDYSYEGPQGSISVSELYPALQVANLKAPSSWVTLTDLDDGVRRRRTQNDVNGDALQPLGNISVTTGRVYAHKSACEQVDERESGRLAWWSTVSGSGDLAPGINGNQISDNVGAFAIFAPESTVRGGVLDSGGANIPNSVFDATYASFARCLVVDYGENRLLQSTTYDNASWSKIGASITANQAESWTADNDMDEIIEDTSTGNHLVAQAVTAGAGFTSFWTMTLFFRANTQQRIYCVLDDGADNAVRAYFDAVLGTVTAQGTSGTGALQVATMHDYGGGLYRARLTGKIPGPTSIRVRVFMCDGANNTINYTGDGSSSLYIGTCQVHNGSQPTYPVDTTTADADATAQSGSMVRVAGGDEDTAGLLVAGDQVEINGQLCVVTNELDSDPSGCGVLRVSPRLRNVPTPVDGLSNEVAVVLEKPEGRFLLASPQAGWRSVPLYFSDHTLSLVEDYSA